MAIATPVKLEVPKDPLFVGSYARIPVIIPPSAGIGFDDLEFIVPDGSAAGQVSYSREEGFDRGRPDIVLLAGYQPGSYRIRVLDARTHAAIAEHPFEVTGLWRDYATGPAFWFAGKLESYGAGAWGGGPFGLQNMDVHPAPATWRLAAVMIDFTDQLYTIDAATLQAFRDDWYNEIVSGVNIGAVTRSVKNYYREASFNTFDLVFTRADLYGPVHLPGMWKTYYKQIASPDARWLVNDWQALVTGVQSALDLSQYDAVLFIPHKGAGDPADEQMSIGGVLQTVPRFAWGVSRLGKAPFTTNRGDLTLGVLSMSNEWRSFAGTYVHTGLAHELGHTLGLVDQYYAPASLRPRLATQWDPMASGDDAMPQMCVVHRMMLGWVDAAAIQPFDFARAIGPVNQHVTLLPAELPPPSGGLVGIEVRIADGLNYYFEYRKTQPNQSGDAFLSWDRDNVVLATDMASSPPVNTRPNILTLAGAPHGLGAGESYPETDVSNTAWPGTFLASISGVTGTQADVQIQYGVNGKPDPAIRPWPASPDRPWQSPDIEVQNLRSQMAPEWFNVPWLGHTNTVIATITNRGNIPAPGVRADFYVKDYTVTDAPETLLGSDTRNMLAGEAVTFRSSWTPSAAGHYCLVVRIAHYTPPLAPDLVELTDLNNVAQSNYDRFISKTESPAGRVVTSVTVHNPYPMRTRVFVSPGQSNPLYRTYLGHTWLELEPGESRAIELMFEYGPVGDGERDARFGAANIRKFGALPNDVNVVGLIQDPNDPHILRVAGGAQAQIVTGKNTRIDGLKAGKTFVRGTVRVAATGKPVPRGKVLVTLWTGRGKRRKEVASFPVTLTRGLFDARIKAPWYELEAYYLPPAGYGDCSATIHMAKD